MVILYVCVHMLLNILENCLWDKYSYILYVYFGRHFNYILDVQNINVQFIFRLNNVIV